MFQGIKMVPELCMLMCWYWQKQSGKTDSELMKFNSKEQLWQEGLNVITTQVTIITWLVNPRETVPLQDNKTDKNM